MTAEFVLPVLILLSSLVPGLAIFFLPEEWRGTRTALNLAGAVSKVLLVALVALGIAGGSEYEARLPFLPGIDLALVVDPLAILLMVLSAVLWLVTTIYAVGYLEGSPDRSRFFGFFSICVTATVGVAMAGNMVTFLLFYEVLTLSTYPLVVHRGTEAARSAGRVYLFYTLTGGVLLLAGIVWLHGIAGTPDFAPRGFVAQLPAERQTALIAIFVLLIAGAGVKAALVPLHAWLPQAMVAPAPVSALLHAVAVVKAGAFGIVRVVQNVYGVEFAAELGVTAPLAMLASITIVYGSLRALQQDDLKKRLAFSTVSQVSYIALGVAIAGPIASLGGLVHLVHQGLMKITLFFCAGNLSETLGVRKVSQMGGVGRRMPWTMAAFTIAAFGMIGLPPLAGFISKWYLGLGAALVGDTWVLWVLVASGVLNAAYFLPVLYIAWFANAPAQWPQEKRRGRAETSWLLVPPLVTAALTVVVGLFAAAPWSPLRWVQLIAALGFAQ